MLRRHDLQPYLGWFKSDASLLLQAQHVLHQEAVCIVPRQEDILDHSKDTLLLEAQGLTPHHRGVDQIQAQCICTVLVQNLSWVLHHKWEVYQIGVLLMCMTGACNAGQSAQSKIEMQCRVVKDAVKGHQRGNQQVQNVHASVCAHLSIATVHVTGEPGQTEIHGGLIIPWRSREALLHTCQGRHAQCIQDVCG